MGQVVLSNCGDIFPPRVLFSWYDFFASMNDQCAPGHWVACFREFYLQEYG